MDRVRLQDEGAFLHLDTLLVEDSGEYNCTVSNEIDGEVFVEFYVQRLVVQREFISMHISCVSVS